MEPRLVALTGPLKGMTIPLGELEITIGRDAGNEVAINDPLVSRRHCAIRHLGGHVQVSDLQSLNGTFVNGMPIREKALEHHDRIKVGASQFIFLVREDDTALSVPLSDSSDGQIAPAITLQLECEESVDRQVDQVSEKISPNLRPARDLAALLRISTAINGIKKPQELESRVLDMPACTAAGCANRWAT